jgi:hypothetical protein
MTLKNPNETRGRKRLTKYDKILKYIRSRTGRHQYGEITFASDDPGKDAEQFRALTAFKELQRDAPGMVFQIFTKASGFVVCWEEGLR